MAESDQDPQANPPQRVSLDKAMVKEALSELLNETPAFRQFLTKKATTNPPDTATGNPSGTAHGSGKLGPFLPCFL